MALHYCHWNRMSMHAWAHRLLTLPSPHVIPLNLLCGMKHDWLVLNAWFAYSNFLFCLFLQVHVQPILSILLATFAGFGVVMSGSSVLVEIFRWRSRWLALQEQQRQTANTVSQPHSGPPSTSQTAVVSNQQNSSQSWISNLSLSFSLYGFFVAVMKLIWEE